MRMFPAPPRLRDYGIVMLLLIGAADALFFDTLGQSVGLSASLFVALVGLAVAAGHRHLLGRHLVPHATLLAVALLLLVENVDARSLTVAIACLAGFALAAARRLPPGIDAPIALGRFLIATPLALYRDNRRRLAAQRRATQRGSKTTALFRTWSIWLMPILLAVAFVALLGVGNPILERWLTLIDPRVLLELLDPIRIFFWSFVTVFAWPILRPRLRLRRHGGWIVPARPDGAKGAADGLSALSRLIFGPAAILRALVLFNMVFAVQTLLDAAYLWGGVQLPDGVSYAAYAHRGAYTLVVTALLAAAFVLLALRPGAAAAADRGIRVLVYLWIAQNVALVLSAMLRLDLYVDVYALTHLRLAAFVWMGIVAAGLVLICISIACRRSNRWLLGANLVVLTVVFAGSCLVDDNALIAGFNVSHSQEVAGQGASLDVRHLVSLGPAAIPAIDLFLAHAQTIEPTIFGQELPGAPMLRDWRRRLAFDHRTMSQDWRNWTFRNWRLSRYLDAAAAPVPATPGGQPLQPADGPN